MWACLYVCLCLYPRAHTHTHTHTFNGPLSRTTRVSRYQRGKTNLDFTEARDSKWQWHQLGRMQVCTLLQTDNHASTPPLSFFTGRMPFLPPNEQRQSTEGTISVSTSISQNQMSKLRRFFCFFSLPVIMARSFCQSALQYVRYFRLCE